MTKASSGSSSDSGHYEVLAVKYAERNNRTRSESFICDPPDPFHDQPHALDYYVWVIRNKARTLLVDTGYDTKEAQRRQRPIQLDPADALADIGIKPEAIDACIVTHLHYDHAGGLDAFENARLHLQEAEMAYATGVCMCDPAHRGLFTADHVCTMVKRVYSGKVTFHDGDGEAAPGITVHRISGHTQGLQAVRVMTENGPLVLASDASHYYENFMERKLFPAVIDTQAMAKGFERLVALADGDASRVVPGHDPLVRSYFEQVFPGSKGAVHRLDRGPLGKIG